MIKNSEKKALSKTHRLSGEMVATMVSWVEAMQGRRGIDDALKKVANLTGADATGLHKFDHGNNEAAETIAVHKKSAGKVFSSRTWKAHAPGHVLKRASDGSFWTKAELFDDTGSDLVNTRRTDTKLKEVAVISLQNNSEELSVMELQFHLYPTQPSMDALACLAEHFSDSWCRRLPGVDVVPTVKAVADDEEDAAPKPILTHKNPFGLSKTEFRICMLLSKGASVKTIAAVSQTRERTVRTHLSSIYAKVGVDGQLQLLHHLMDGDTEVA